MVTQVENFALTMACNTEFLTKEQAYEHVFIATNGLRDVLNEEERTRFGPEPKTWKEMLKRPDSDKWIQAAQEEIQVLLLNGTWSVEELPPGRKTVGNRWVFKLKRKPDGSIERFKARLVAKGFSQRPGFDYDETFSPTATWAVLRTIMAIVAIEDLTLISADISNAFLNGDLDHEVYMDMPEGHDVLGIHKPGAGFVLKLLKALYGLKQAGRQWHIKLDSTLESLGFTKAKVDHSVWIYKKDDTRIIIPAYVDDLMIATKNPEDAQNTLKQLEKVFKLRNLGPTSFILSVNIEHDRSKKQLSLSQKQYIVDLLQHYSMEDCSGVDTPVDPNNKLSKAQTPSNEEEKQKMTSYPYAQLVGSLMYLAICTQPDISYAVGLLGRYSANPGLTHWKAAKHLLRYLQKTKEYKLIYKPDNNQLEPFTTFSDAAFANDIDSRRSTNGYLVKMGTGAVSWSSHLQPIVTLSTTEAEYVSAVRAGQEAI